MKSKIYLAGGIRSNWQENVTSKVNADFYNPQLKESRNELSLSEYGTWDLHYIKQCDIVFGYMEKTNPSGIGMALEIGYAKGLGKTVILCIEQNNMYVKDRYIDFMKKVADIVFTDFDDAIEYLSLFNIN